MKVPIFVKTVAWGLLVYLLYCAALFLLQRKMLFPRYLVGTPPAPEVDIPGLEKIWLNTSFGNVEAWFLGAWPGPAAEPVPAVIFAHGNGELIDFWVEEFRALAELNIAVFLVEYPGYGRSQGSPSQPSITEALVTAYDVLAARRDIDSSRIVLCGRSIGGAAVSMLAEKRPSAALILMSTFVSARSFASRYLVPAFLVRDPFDALDVVRKYTRPVLVIHGKYDDIIPFSHGRALYQAAQHGKFIPYECGHNDCPPDWAVFWKDIRLFLNDAGI